jgi:hypothetical protein
MSLFRLASRKKLMAMSRDGLAVDAGVSAGIFHTIMAALCREPTKICGDLKDAPQCARLCTLDQ